MGCASSVLASSIEVPSSWSSLIQAEANKPNRPVVQRLFAKLVPLVQSVEALPPCKKRDTLLRQTWTVHGEWAMLDKEAAKKAAENKDWSLMLRYQAACERRLHEAADKLRLFLANTSKKAAAVTTVSPTEALEARRDAIINTRWPHDNT